MKQLISIARDWLDENNDYRLQAVQHAASEFCLSRASFELALDWIFGLWTESNIAALYAKNPYKNIRYAVQILAGNTPAMLAQGFLQGAILQVPQFIKLPSHQSRFAKLLHQSFIKHANDVAQLFEVDHDSSTLYARLQKAELVIANGNDHTIAEIKRFISPQTTYIAHGHAESVAIIFKEAIHEESLKKLAYDMLSYDQRGCLSPRITYIEKGGAWSPEECARKFAEDILPAVAEQLPRGGLFLGEAEAILHQRIVHGFRGRIFNGSDWTVSYCEHPKNLTALPRFMVVSPFDEVNTLRRYLNSADYEIKSIGVAGLSCDSERLNFISNKTRISALGEMQRQLLFL